MSRYARYKDDTLLEKSPFSLATVRQRMAILVIGEEIHRSQTIICDLKPAVRAAGWAIDFESEAQQNLTAKGFYEYARDQLRLERTRSLELCAELAVAKAAVSPNFA